MVGQENTGLAISSNYEVYELILALSFNRSLEYRNGQMRYAGHLLLFLVPGTAATALVRSAKHGRGSVGASVAFRNGHAHILVLYCLGFGYGGALA